MGGTALLAEAKVSGGVFLFAMPHLRGRLSPGKAILRVSEVLGTPALEARVRLSQVNQPSRDEGAHDDADSKHREHNF